MKTDYMRGLDFYDPARQKPHVLVVGAGSIGSYTTFGLARMGVKDITIVDFDMVEAHNLPNQFFSEDLPEGGAILKVIALDEAIKKIIPKVKINVIPTEVQQYLTAEFQNGSAKIFDVAFILVDDMNVRKWLWTFQKEHPFTKALVDARVGGEFANIISIDLRRSAQKEYYEKQLWSNEQSVNLPCTGTSIIDVTFGVAGECISRFRRLVKGSNSIIHTFHDYKMSTSAICHHTTLEDNHIRTTEIMANVGNETAEETNG